MKFSPPTYNYVILTAYYLINHMPSSILSNQVPHSLLFPNQPLFYLPLRVFGCTCFVRILLAKIRFPRSVSSLVILAFNEVIDATLLIHIDTSYPLTSPFLNILLSSLSHLLPVPRSYLYLLSFPFWLSHESLATPPRLLQVYTRHLRTDTKPPDDSSPMAPSSTMSVLLSPVDPPIPIQKVTCSSHNPHHVYNFMSYHHLSSPYSAFISTLSYVSLPNTVNEALSHPGWKHAMVEEMTVLHSISTWDLLVPCWLPLGLYC